MNQILYTGDKNQKIEINKIVKIFCIIIIIFAILLIGQGTYFLIKNNNKKVKNNQNTIEPQVVANAEGSNIEIIIKHEIAIEKLYYSWKNGKETEINNVSGKNEIREEIILPNEDTTLNLRIIDINNDEYKFTKEFKYNDNIDVVKPRIQFNSITGNVVVTVTDNKEISYIEYKWNDEETIKIEANQEQKTKLEQKIVVKEGKNKLIVTAVDASGNVASEEKEIITVTKPIIQLKRSKGEIIIKVSDEDEITKVVYEINGTEYTKENTGNNKKEMEIRDLLIKGENIIKVTAYNKAGLSSEKIGKCTY